MPDRILQNKSHRKKPETPFCCSLPCKTEFWNSLKNLNSCSRNKNMNKLKTPWTPVFAFRTRQYLKQYFCILHKNHITFHSSLTYYTRTMLYALLGKCDVSIKFFLKFLRTFFCNLSIILLPSKSLYVINKVHADWVIIT